jgi:hypothetical protein
VPRASASLKSRVLFKAFPPSPGVGKCRTSTTHASSDSLNIAKMPRPYLLLLSSLTFTAATTTLTTCYAPNGTAITTDPCCDGIYSPCNGTGMCCALGRPVYHPNTCLGNGLCEDVATGWIWRESCTDPTWQDPRCLKLCMEDSKLTLCAAREGCGSSELE